MNGQWFLGLKVRVRNEKKAKSIVRERQISLAATSIEEAKQQSLELVEKINQVSSSGDRSSLEEFCGRIEDEDTVAFFGVGIHFSEGLPVYMPGIQ